MYIPSCQIEINVLDYGEMIGSIVDIVLFIKEKKSQGLNIPEIKNILLIEGYGIYEIEKAITFSIRSNNKNVLERSISPLESAYFSKNAIKYLYRLSYYNILSKEQFETIVDDITSYSAHSVSEDEVKLLVSIMLFNEPPELILPQKSIEEQFIH